MNRLYILLVVLITSCSSELEKSLIIDKIPDDPVLTISIKEFENVNFQTLEFISESVDFDFSSIENYSSKGEVLISFHYTSKNKLDHFLVQDFPDTLSNKFHDSFSVALIPHTLEITTWKNKKIGDSINVEVDMMAKYLENFIGNKNAV